jgi:periplasmic divalent cation tolerance protein
LLRDRVVGLHPHEVPCVERFGATDLLDAFGEWVTTNVD